MIARGCSSRRVNAYADQGPSQAACVLRFQTYVVNVGSDNELDAGFAGLVQQPADAIFVGADPFISCFADRLSHCRWLHVIKFPPFTTLRLPPWLAA